jgi:hypothetical protein
MRQRYGRHMSITPHLVVQGAERAAACYDVVVAAAARAFA